MSHTETNRHKLPKVNKLKKKYCKILISFYGFRLYLCFLLYFLLLLPQFDRTRSSSPRPPKLYRTTAKRAPAMEEINYFNKLTAAVRLVPSVTISGRSTFQNRLIEFLSLKKINKQTNALNSYQFCNGILMFLYFNHVLFEFFCPF